MGLSVHDPFVDPLGNPLGLAKVLGLLSINPTIVDLTGGFESSIDVVGDYVIPSGFSFFRVTVVGAGGAGTSIYSATGGGLARSAILPVKKGLVISYVAATYTVTAASTPASVGRTSSARFLDTVLQATGGQAGGPGMLGGVGSGGVDNFNGGTVGANTSGTGAAGTNGNGANSPASVGSPGLAGTGDAGGSGASVSSGLQAGGGGWMGRGGSAANPRGGAPDDLYSRDAIGGQGGGWGGGGGKSNYGGFGGVRIELW